MGRSAELAAELRELLEQTTKATEAFIAEEKARGYDETPSSTTPFTLGYLRAGVQAIAERLEQRERHMLERRRSKVEAWRASRLPRA
jgi:hypothetical protein